MANEATEQTAQGIVSGQGVSLGCGTLILIALIVMFFSKGGADTKHLEGIDQKLKSIEQRLERIEQSLPAAKKAA